MRSMSLQPRFPSKLHKRSDLDPWVNDYDYWETDINSQETSETEIQRVDSSFPKRLKEFLLVGDVGDVFDQLKPSDGFGIFTLAFFYIYLKGGAVLSFTGIQAAVVLLSAIFSIATRSVANFRLGGLGLASLLISRCKPRDQFLIWGMFIALAKFLPPVSVPSLLIPLTRVAKFNFIAKFVVNTVERLLLGGLRRGRSERKRHIQKRSLAERSISNSDKNIKALGTLDSGYLLFIYSAYSRRYPSTGSCDIEKRRYTEPVPRTPWIQRQANKLFHQIC